MVAPMSPLGEFTAVRELRKFLIDFGDVLQFSAARWASAVLLLYHNDQEERFISKRSRRRRPQHEEKSDSAAAVPGAKKNGPYVLETHGKHYLVRVPHDFKDRHLLEFLGETLPVAKLVPVAR